MALTLKQAFTHFWAQIVAHFVHQEEGKGLSTNDYTTAEKNKLASLNNAEAITPEQIAAVCGVTVYNARKAVL